MRVDLRARLVATRGSSRKLAAFTVVRNGMAITGGSVVPRHAMLGDLLIRAARLALRKHYGNADGNLVLGFESAADLLAFQRRCLKLEPNDPVRLLDVALHALDEPVQRNVRSVLRKQLRLTNLSYEAARAKVRTR